MNERRLTPNFVENVNVGKMSFDPPVIPPVSNWLGFTDDEGASGQSGLLGGPMTADQKTGLLFSGLRDMASRLSSGGPDPAEMIKLSPQVSGGRRVAAQQRLQDAIARGDVEAIRAAQYELINEL